MVDICKPVYLKKVGKFERIRGAFLQTFFKVSPSVVVYLGWISVLNGKFEVLLLYKNYISQQPEKNTKTVRVRMKLLFFFLRSYLMIFTVIFGGLHSREKQNKT